MATIGSMTLLIEAQSATFLREVAKVERATAAMARNVAAQNTTMQTAYAKTAGAVATLTRGLGALGIAVSVSTIVSATRNTFAWADALSELSDRVGVSVEQLQRLERAGQLTNISQQQITKNLEFLGRQLGETAKGAGTFGRVLADAGIELRNQDASLRSISAVFDDVAEKVANAATEQEALALAYAAFGRSGAAFVTTIQEMQRAQDSLNVLTDGQIEALGRYDDKIVQIQQRLEFEFKRTLATTIQEFEGLQRAGTEALRAILGVLDDFVGTSLASAIAAPADEFAQLLDELTAGVPIAIRMAGGVDDLTGAVEELTAAQKRLAEAGKILKQTSAQEERFLAREEERTRQLEAQLSTLQAMNDEELQRRTGQATAGGLSGPGLPPDFEQQLSEPFKNALESVQAEFTSTFDSISQGVIRSFEDMAASAHGIFTNLAANVASLAIFDPAAFKQLAAQSSVGAGGIGAAAFGTPAVGLAAGLSGNQGAMQGVEFGGAGGAALGALAGTFLFPGVGTAAGGLLGGLAGSIGGGLLGGLFGGGKDKRARFSGSGGLGDIGGGGEIGRFLQDIDQSLISLLNSRQEELVNEVLRQSQVSIRAKDFDQNVRNFAASQRVGPAAQALGFNAQAVTGGGNIGAQQQIQNLQTALAVQDTIRRLVEPAFEVANEDLANQFEEITATAKRFGVSLDGLSAAQDTAARDLQRAQDAALGSLFDPFRALAGELEAFQTELRFAGLNPAEQARFAQEEFRRIAEEAATGSTTALQQIDEAGRLYIQTQNAAGASPAAARATEEVARVTAAGLEAVREAEQEAGEGVMDAVDRHRREEIDTLRELIEEVRIMARKLDKPRI